MTLYMFIQIYIALTYTGKGAYYFRLFLCLGSWSFDRMGERPQLTQTYRSSVVWMIGALQPIHLSRALRTARG